MTNTLFSVSYCCLKINCDHFVSSQMEEVPRLMESVLPEVQEQQAMQEAAHLQLQQLQADQEQGQKEQDEEMEVCDGEDHQQGEEEVVKLEADGTSGEKLDAEGSSGEKLDADGSSGEKLEAPGSLEGNVSEDETMTEGRGSNSNWAEEPPSGQVESGAVHEDVMVPEVRSQEITEQEAKCVEKLNAVAARVQEFLEFQPEAFQLSSLTIQQIEVFAVPLLAEFLEMLRAAVTVEAWAGSDLFRWHQEVVSRDFAEFPIKNLSKNAQIFFKGQFSAIIEAGTQVLLAALPVTEDLYQVETLREQLAVSLQIASFAENDRDDLAKQLDKYSQQVDNLRTTMHANVEETQTIKENYELCKKEYEKYECLYFEAKAKLDKVDSEKMSKDMEQLRLSLTTANQTMKAQMLIIQRYKATNTELEAKEESNQRQIIELEGQIEQFQMQKETAEFDLDDDEEDEGEIKVKRQKLQVSSAKTPQAGAEGGARPKLQNKQYVDVARTEVTVKSLMKRGFVTFLCRGPRQFDKRSLQDAKRSLEQLETMVYSLLTELQKTFPQDFKVISEGTDWKAATEAFQKFQYHLKFPRSQMDLLHHVVEMRKKDYDCRVFNPRLRSKNILTLQQYPDVSPARNFFEVLFNEDTGLFHKHAILAIYSLYCPQLYEVITVVDFAGNTQEKKLFRYLWGERNSSKFYVALQLLVVIIMDQCRVVSDIEQGLSYYHNMTRSKSVSSSMLPPNDGYFTEDTLSDIKTMRPVNYSMDELRILFLEKRNLDLYKEVFIQERDKVKKMVKDAQDQLLQQEVPDYSEFE